MTAVRIRPATGVDVLELYGEPLAHTMRAITAEVDGRVLGISGVIHDSPLQAFSTMLPEMQNHPMVIRTAIREMRKIIEGYGAPVYAAPDEKYENSRRVLELTGFRQVADSKYMVFGA